jgi:hypothetical protein
MFSSCSKGRFVKHPLDALLTDHLKGATHLTISCTSIARCGRSTTMLTADLVARLPQARTVREFQRKLVCQRCRHRGWSSIGPAGRG